MARSVFADDGISIKEANDRVFSQEPQPSQKSARRPDMRGPSDLNDILSGLKTKTIDIAAPPSFSNVSMQGQQSRMDPNVTLEDVNNSSTISIDDLKSIQSDANVPKRSRRRPKSDKNIVSLDI